MSNQARSFALTAATDKSVKTVPVTVKKAVIFFIGGAADKERYYGQGPNNNIRDAQQLLDPDFIQYGDQYFSDHIDYKYAKGEKDISEYFTKYIPSKANPVFIVGHSLGAWNGAHLSSILTDKGYRVSMLITLDPVGVGIGVSIVSDIYASKPQPKSEFWINVTAVPKQKNASDNVAWMGGRWYVDKGPNLLATADINHADAGLMFSTPLHGGPSAMDYLKEKLEVYLNEK